MSSNSAARPIRTIDLRREPAVSLARAAKLPELARDGRSPNPSTIFRWASRGIARNGRRVVLETVQQGGTRVTTRSAIGRFLEELSAVAPATHVLHAARTPDARAINEADAELAERELAAAGFRAARPRESAGTP